MFTKKLIPFLSLGVLALNLLMIPLAQAATSSDPGISLEISPSPIVETVKPGEHKTLELKIYNGGTTQENLKIEVQSFNVASDTGKVTLDPSKPSEVAGWVSFVHPTFSIKPGERTTQLINIDTPKSAGFSYSFAMVISRQSAPKAASGQTAIQGSVASFTLLNVDRPGAKKSLQISSLTSLHHVYEYLPATFTLKLRNNGNSLLLPAGNVYIQRKSNSNKPLTILPVNPGSLYLLPGVTREYPLSWADGVPVRVSTQDVANAAPKQHLEWHWRDSQFRIGRYVARVVVIYNNGQRDVPLQTEISFWVLPWKIMLGLLVALLILLIGIIATIKFFFRLGKHSRHGHHKRSD
jgi:hypothetical protein